MKSLKQGAGYVIVDHRDSPGLPGQPGMGEGSIFERDVMQCTHCQCQIVLHPLRTRDRGFCPKCNHYVCDSCETIRAKTGECVPFVKILDTAAEIAEKYVKQPDHPENDPDSALAGTKGGRIQIAT